VRRAAAHGPGPGPSEQLHWHMVWPWAMGSLVNRPGSADWLTCVYGPDHRVSSGIHHHDHDHPDGRLRPHPCYPLPQTYPTPRRLPQCKCGDSDRLGSTRIGSDRLGSTRIDSDRLGSTRIDSD
jgi:hypothetical protein